MGEERASRIGPRRLINRDESQKRSTPRRPARRAARLCPSRKEARRRMFRNRLISVPEHQTTFPTSPTSPTFPTMRTSSTTRRRRGAARVVSKVSKARLRSRRRGRARRRRHRVGRRERRTIPTGTTGRQLSGPPSMTQWTEWTSFRRRNVRGTSFRASATRRIAEEPPRNRGRRRGRVAAASPRVPPRDWTTRTGTAGSCRR